MVTLTIDNSVSKIEGLSRNQFIDLKSFLSYTPDRGHFTQFRFERPRSLIDKHGQFPTGLLYIVEKWLEAFPYTRNDIRRIPRGHQGLFKADWGIPLRPFQKEAVKAIKRENGRGIISCVTGSGKSIIAAAIIQELQVPSLIIVPSLELKRQLTETLQMIFGLEKVGKGKPIVVKNIDEINLKKEETEYDCVIIDEFHHSGAKTYRIANQKCWNKIFYRIGLTATPYRSNDNERILLESVLSKVIYTLSYTKAVELGYVVPVEAFSIQTPKILTKHRTWQGVYKELVVNNEARNKIIADLITHLNQSKKATLCLVKEIEHGKIISNLTNIPFANGEEGNTRDLLGKFNKSEIKCLIGTTGVLGEGVDTRPCEYIIIAGLGKSKNAFLQNVGRGLRLYPDKESCKVIIFLDRSHKFPIRHYKEQVKILLEEYGVNIVSLD